MNARLFAEVSKIRWWTMQRDILVSMLTAIRSDASLPTEIVAAARARRTPAASGIQVIPICGAIMPNDSFFLQLFGGTSIAGFREAFRRALADDSVRAIVLDVDSPGGAVDGTPAMAREIYQARDTKPIVAASNTMMASAAYWLGSQCSAIIASPVDSDTGSVGAYAEHEDMSQMLENVGVKVTLISAGDGKVDGNPYEPLSDTARSDAQARIDEIYNAFVAAVARGRKATRDQIRDTWKAKTYSADKAMSLGMVDGSGTLEDAIAYAAKLVTGAKSVAMSSSVVADGAAQPVDTDAIVDTVRDALAPSSPVDYSAEDAAIAIAERL